MYLLLSALRTLLLLDDAAIIVCFIIHKSIYSMKMWGSFLPLTLHHDSSSIGHLAPWLLLVVVVMLMMMMIGTSRILNSMGPKSASLSLEDEEEEDAGSSSSFAWWSLFLYVLQHYLVPTYTTCVLLYLAAVALRPKLVDDYCWRPLLSLPDDDINDIEVRKRRQLRSLSTTASTMPLEQEEEEEFSVQEANEKAQQQEQQQQQPIDMSGAFKLVSNDNFEQFLAVQGLPWALRRAANQARPVHRITHMGCNITIKIEGIIESQTSYIINGPPVETQVRGRIFRDVVSYLTRAAVQQNDANFANGAGHIAPPGNDDCLENSSSNANNNNNCHDENENGNSNSSKSKSDIVGIIVHKEALQENYTLTIQRQLSLPDQQEIIMTSTAFFRDGRDPVRCIQKFQRVVESS